MGRERDRDGFRNRDRVRTEQARQDPGAGLRPGRPPAEPPLRRRIGPVAFGLMAALGLVLCLGALLERAAEDAVRARSVVVPATVTAVNAAPARSSSHRLSHAYTLDGQRYAAHAVAIERARPRTLSVGDTLAVRVLREAPEQSRPVARPDATGAVPALLAGVALMLTAAAGLLTLRGTGSDGAPLPRVRCDPPTGPPRT